MATHIWMSGHLIRSGTAVCRHGSSASTAGRACTLLCVVPLVLITACAKSPLAPTASSRTTAVTASAGPSINIDDPNIGDPDEKKTFVLLAQLYSYEDPNENNVLGTLTVRLTQAIGDPSIFNATGLATIPSIRPANATSPRMSTSPPSPKRPSISARPRPNSPDKARGSHASPSLGCGKTKPR